MVRRWATERKPRELRIPDTGEILGVATQMLGFDRLRVRCQDGHERICRIPGRMKKKQWIHTGDVVLVAPWDFDDKRGDVRQRYTRDEVRKLEERSLFKRLE